jgi:hypothetical protein
MLFMSRPKFSRFAFVLRLFFDFLNQSRVEGAVNSMKLKTQVFFQINVQEFYF